MTTEAAPSPTTPEVPTACTGGCGLQFLPHRDTEALAVFARLFPQGLCCDACRYRAATAAADDAP